ncbi:MAG: hypothetical protein LN413_05960 [Candidatus Thermoplasmatota archaeon]|nr:hypothetical protein [Candidatus Thermoplasmatota archaeon]
MQETLTLQAKGAKGAVAELAVELTPGQTVSYHWKADKEVEFNIHSHQGEAVTYHERLSQREADGVFGSRTSGEYYLMWENGDPDPVEIRVELRR